MSRQGRNGLENLKTETARELGIDLSEADGKQLSSVQSGRIGGQMVRRMIEDYQRQNSRKPVQ